MMGVDFPVHHVVACQRLVLCFLRPMFCDNPGDWPGWKVLCMGCGLQGFVYVFPCGIVDNRTEVLVEVCHLSDITGFVWEAGGAWLSAVPSGRGLISLRKAAGGPFCGIQAWYGEEAPGEGRASHEAGWAAQTVSSLHILFNYGQNPGVEGGCMFGLGWWMLFLSLCLSTHSCFASPMPDKSSVCCQPSLLWGKVM